MKNYKLLFSFLLILAAGLSACKKDFLNRPPEDRLAVDNFYKTPEDLRLATAPLYNIVWFDFHNRAIMQVGESRGGNLLAPYNSEPWYMFTLSSLDGNMFDAWTGSHNVIGQANTIMRGIEKNATGVTDAQKRAAIAEARFMRGTAYFNLVRAWGPVIIIENNEDFLKNPFVRTNKIEDVYKFIVNDFTYASRYLPTKDVAGRVTQWAAKGMLAKAYLARSGYNNGGTRKQSDLDSAKYYAANVINDSGLSLQENYEDLYKYQFRNNQESLFSLQWVPNGGWLVGNTLVSDLAFNSTVLGGANGWSSTYASYSMLKSYEPGDTLRRNATWMTAGTKYSYINKAAGGYTFPKNDTTYAPIKKYVPGGTADNDGAIVAAQSSPLTTYMLRLADVYLVYAEASLGNQATLTGADPGLKAFNDVRARAKIPAKTTINFNDIINERRVEFAMEFQFWYELVTWGYFKPTEILTYINAQERGSSYTYHKDAQGNLILRVNTRKANPVQATSATMRLPYPEREVVQNPLLKEEPVAYDWK